MAEELWALGVEASISESGSWTGGQGPGHRARLAVVGGRMWEELGVLVLCTAAGRWLTPRRTIPEEAAVRNWGRRGSLVDSQPPGLPDPGLFIWAAAGLLEELSPVVPEVRVPEVRVPSDH